MSDLRYYGLLYRLDGSYRWLLWYSDKVDRLYLEEGLFPSFATAKSLSAYASARGLIVDTAEASVHDVDSVMRWLSRPSAIAIDSGDFLAAWNLVTDVAASVGQSLADRDDVADRAYEKLFRRGGPQWIAHPDKPKLTAEWTPEEVQRLSQVLGRGLKLLRSHVAARG